VCAAQDVACRERRSARTGRRFDYVYVARRATLDGAPSPYAQSLLQSLRADPRFHLVYDGPGATIFAGR
jgi:hypothetical protein